MWDSDQNIHKSLKHLHFTMGDDVILYHILKSFQFHPKSLIYGNDVVEMKIQFFSLV